MVAKFPLFSRSQGFYGWSILAAAAFAVFMSGPGQTYGVSVFIDPLVEDTGWSRSLVSTIYSLATLSSAATILIVGRAIDRRGNRSILLVATIFFGIGLLIASFAIHPAMLLVAFALMRSFGSGSLTLASRTLIPHWFVANRGRAFSIVGLASAVSLAFFPPFGNFLIGLTNWRTAWRIDALLMIGVLLPILYLVMRDRPADVGQVADGASVDQSGKEHIETLESEPSWTLKQAMRTKSFWLLILAGIVPAQVGTGLAFSQVSILTERGFSSGLAASTFTIESAVAAPMTLLSGFLADRFLPRYLLALSQALLAASLVALYLAEAVPLVLLFAAARGMSQGLWMVAADVVWPGYFGRRYLGSIRGATFAVGIVGAAIGPIPLSVAFDVLGSYNAAIAGLIIVPIAGFIAVLFARPPARTVSGASST